MMGMRKKGATALTYALVVGLISLLAIGAVTRVGDSTQVLFGRASDSLVGGRGSGAPDQPEVCAAGSQTFSATGSDQPFRVPAGCETVSVVVWAAGGGANGLVADSSSTAYGGGAGGAAEATFPVTPGETLTVVVGRGGGAGPGAGAYGGGGPHNNPSARGSRGGGLSGLFRGAFSASQPDNALVIAGGGGGGPRAEASLGGRAGAGGV